MKELRKFFQVVMDARQIGKATVFKHECFSFSLGQYLFYGGYPGVAFLIGDEDRFSQYIQSAVIEVTIDKDILMDTSINKLTLIRPTFELGAACSGGLLLLNKILGSFQDAGNMVTLAGYINLLDESELCILALIQVY